MLQASWAPAVLAGVAATVVSLGVAWGWSSWREALQGLWRGLSHQTSMRSRTLGTPAAQTPVVWLALLAGVALGTAVAVGSFMRSWVAAAVVLAAAFAVPGMVRKHILQRTRRMFDEQWPDCLGMVSGALRAGLTLNGAMSSVVGDLPFPMSREVGIMLRDQRLGVPLNRVLADLARRMPTRTTVLVTSAMAIASETGGGLAETLERTSKTARRQLNMESKIDALTAQGKLQTWVVGAMPILLLLVLTQMEPEAMHLLWTTPMGWAVCAVIAVLEACGVFMILRITTIDV